MLRICVAIFVVVSFRSTLVGQDTLPLEKVGVRKIEFENKTYSFPWYHVAVDHHQIRTNKAWSRIDPLSGSKSVHIGDYGLLEEIEFLDNGHSSAFLPGVSLYASDDRGLKVGPGAVYIRRWYFEETLKTGSMRFKEKGHNYGSVEKFEDCLPR